MPVLEHILPHVVPFLLVMTRMAGLFLLTPILANRMAPRRFRAMLAVMSGAAVYAGAPSSMQIAPDADVFSLLSLVVGEVLIGATIGFVAGLPILSLDMAGFLMGHQMGLGIARAYNPEIDADSDVIGQLLMYLGLGAFVSVGGLEAAYVAVLHTFDRVPIGAFSTDRVPLDLVVGVVASGWELALRVATPVLCMILLLMVALGFAMKTMPQINIMSVGFTIKIVCGLALLVAALATIEQVASDEVERVMRLLLDWGGAV